MNKLWFILIILAFIVLGGTGGGIVGIIIPSLVKFNLEAYEKFDVFVNLMIIALTLLSLLAAVIGFSIYEIIKERLFRQIDEESQKIRNFYALSLGKINSEMGINLWELFMIENMKEREQKTTNTTFRKTSHQYIKLAIERTKLSLEKVKNLPEDQYERDILIMQNNFVYFISEAARVGAELSQEDKKKALEMVTAMFRKASKEKYPEEFYMFKDTCAWALMHLTDKEDRKSKDKSIEIVKELERDVPIPIPTIWWNEHSKKWDDYK